MYVMLEGVLGEPLEMTRITMEVSVERGWGCFIFDINWSKIKITLLNFKALFRRKNFGKLQVFWNKTEFYYLIMRFNEIIIAS